MFATCDKVVGGDANIRVFWVRDVDEAVNVVDEGLIGGSCEEGADEGGVTELQLGAGEADGEHGIETILDFGERTKP